ncbi:MAG TPA: hypothetical protein VF785_04375 [Gemmatimonadaceae bacterium]|jgi:hypothetical protein
MMKPVHFLAVAAIVVTPAARAQRPPTPAKADTPARASNAYRYRILGVFDELTGDPVEDVEVADVLSGNSSLTTKTGTVSLFFLPEGGSLVRLRKVGYAVQTFPVPISPADTAPITIVLARATQLETVVVKDSAPKYLSPSLRTFEERRAKGIGHFVSEADMRKNDDKTLAELLPSRIPGLTTTPGAGSARYLTTSRKRCSGPALRTCQSPDCFVSVYVDGVKTFDASMGRALIPDFSIMNPRDYAAAEFYAGGASLPVEYNSTSSGCGVLLLWTRER